MLFLTLSFFLSITLMIYAVFSIPAYKNRMVPGRIALYFPDEDVSEDINIDMEGASFKDRMIKPGWKSIKKKFQRKLAKDKVDKMEVRLLQAGMKLSPIEFKMVQWILSGGLVVLSVLVMVFMNISVFHGILLILTGIGAGITLPKMNMNMKAKKRQAQALKELPDFLDLLTISLEAGLGFDAALSKVVAKKPGVLSEEFKFVLEEVRLGRTRRQGLAAMIERLPVEELKSLVFSIIQAEKLGIGMVTVLRVQTEEIRELRKQRAEEKAMKAPVKMLFPMVLFIFPALFIVLLSPAIMQFLDAMQDM
ncbi:type II secretion system F family protein [Salinicoccus halitifaciens]|uniref:Tight adherence protein C n=1 Tax=Salinicoccus halitifaciens TaxID=1073415 RepID=A0ABV2E979_9STAP|nr:type II secretion system F family protein [Salinicoccus halitifaciens]MCD2137989.1 type II secretion system F family protein [Salinicoccus halitifaciens]